MSPGVADDGVVDRVPTADVLADGVDLHDDLPGRVELLVGEVGADHEQQVAAVERDRAGVVAQQAGLPDLEGVVVLEPLLALEGDHHRGGEPLRDGEHRGPRVACTRADEHRDPIRPVDRGRGLRDRGGQRVAPAGAR